MSEPKVIKIGKIRKSITELSNEEHKQINEEYENIQTKLKQYMTNILEYNIMNIPEYYDIEVSKIVDHFYSKCNEKEKVQAELSISSFMSLIQALTGVSSFYKLFEKDVVLKFQVAMWRTRALHNLVYGTTVSPLYQFDPGFIFRAITSSNQRSKSPYDYSFDIKGNKLNIESMVENGQFILPVVFPDIEIYSKSRVKIRNKCSNDKCKSNPIESNESLHQIIINNTSENPYQHAFSKQTTKINPAKQCLHCNGSKFTSLETITDIPSVLIFSYDFNSHNGDMNYFAEMGKINIPENLDIVISQKIRTERVIAVNPGEEKTSEFYNLDTVKAKTISDVVSYKLVSQIIKQASPASLFETIVRRADNEIYKVYNGEKQKKSMFYNTVQVSGRDGMVLMSIYQYNI